MALVTAVLFLAVAWDRGEFTGPDRPLAVTYLVLALHGMTIGTLFAFGEEYGWRGYLLPRLLPLGQVKAAIIVGLIWGPWHAPLLVAGLNYPGVNPWAAIGIFVLAGIGISLLVTRLYVAAGASVLVAAVFHGSLNAFSDNLTDVDHLSGNSLLVTPGGAIGIGVMALVTLLAYRAHVAARALEPIVAVAGSDEPARGSASSEPASDRR
jgi:membrane protease YdiL (CAAX protease family)